MKGLIGKALLVAAVAVTGVLTPVRAQDQGLRKLEQPERIQVIDGFWMGLSKRSLQVV